MCIKNLGGNRGHLVEQVLPKAFFLCRLSNGDRRQKPTKNQLTES